MNLQPELQIYVFSNQNSETRYGLCKTESSLVLIAINHMHFSIPYDNLMIKYF